jgi:hypothetical protein
LVLLVLALRWTRLIALVLICLAAELVVRDGVAHVPAAAAVAYGVGLLLACELAAWVATLGSRALLEPAVVALRVARLAGVAALGAAASALTLAGSGVSTPDAFVAGVAGAIAVAALLVLVWSLARDRRAM